MVSSGNARVFKRMFLFSIAYLGITICHQEPAFAQVAAGSYHSCAVNSFTGKVYCWGRNVEGQLGDGTNIDRPTPVDITNRFANPIIQISAGDTTTCAVDNTRHVFCWGRGSEGELG